MTSEELSIEEIVMLILVNLTGIESTLTELTPREALIRVEKIVSYAVMLEEKVQDLVDSTENLEVIS